MLPHERRSDAVPTESENHVYSDSAPDRHSQKEFTETLAANSASTPRGAAAVPEPNRLLPVYTSQSLNGLSSSSTILSPLLRRNKAHVASACVNCKKAHLACDGTSLSLVPCLFPTIYGGRSSLAVPSPPPIMAGWIRAAAAECGCMSSGSCAAPSVRDFFLSCVACESGIGDCVGGRGPVSGNGIGNYFLLGVL
jgi:hypothetical protein